MRLEDINETVFQALSPEVQVAIVNQSDYTWMAIIPLLAFIMFAAWSMR